MKNKAIINVTLAAGSATSPYYFLVHLRKSLKRPACIAQMPAFAPQVRLVSYRSIGVGQYEALVNVQGVIGYRRPCGGSAVEVINQNFVVPFYTAAAPESVTVEGGDVTNVLLPSSCGNVSRVFASEFPVTLTIA